MISAISSTQTTILPTARGTLAMGVYGALPKRFGSVHPRFHTPGFSTVLMGVVAASFFVGMSLISDNLLQDTILSLGLAIAFYYAITGFACVWYFRRTLLKSASNLWMRGILPFLGAAMLTAAFGFSVVDMINPDYGYTVLFGIGGVFVVGVGSLAIGAVLMGVWALMPASRPFFRGETLNESSEVLVPESDLPVIRSIDGGR
jgi:amino acid transporter